MKTAALIALGVVSLIGFAAIIRSVWQDYIYRRAPLGAMLVIGLALIIMMGITLMALISITINN